MRFIASFFVCNLFILCTAAVHYYSCKYTLMGFKRHITFSNIIDLIALTLSKLELNNGFIAEIEVVS